MRRNRRLNPRLVFIALCTIALGCSVGPSGDEEGSTPPDAQPRSVIVKYHRTARLARLVADMEVQGFRTESFSESGGFVTVRVPENLSAEEAVATLSGDPSVEYAEPDYIARIAYVPSDPLWNQQWNFRMIGMESAWDVMAQALGVERRGGDPSVIVAVVDSGVAYEDYGIYRRAPDLAGTNFLPGYDFINGDAHANDDNGHGTHVAGTIAQTTGNGLGAAGIAFRSTILPVKALGADGKGNYSAVANGIYWAVNQGAVVINLSLVGDQPSETLRSALAYARGRGVVVVAAVGNGGGSVAYPARYNDLCISVGAVDVSGARASYSNFGTGLDLVAPGGGDGNGIWQQTLSNGNPGIFEYQAKQGTSQAAPHVTGAVALLKALGVADPDEIESILESTAAEWGPTGWDPEFGFGRIDVARAVATAAGVSPPPEPSAPTVILDNGAAGTSSGGLWVTSAMPGGYNGDSLVSLGFGTDWYRWTPQLPSAGDYDVYLWWSSAYTRSNAVPVEIRHAAGSAQLTVNQLENGGLWYHLGAWRFEAGASGWVEISSKNGQACADAVKFVNKEQGVPPPEPPPPASNQNPVASGDGVSTFENTPINISVLINDYDPDGDALAVVDVGMAAHGIASIPAPTTVRYAPAQGFRGTDSFTYTVSDGKGGMAQATVTVLVLAAPVPPPSGTEVVLDDGDPGTASSGYWILSLLPGGHDGDSLVNPGAASEWYRWTPNLPEDGNYDVYMWWSASSSRSSNVPVTVRHADGVADVTVNQTEKGAQWNQFGTWRFQAGNLGSVEVSARSGQTVADAVRFVLKAEGEPPPPPPTPTNQPPTAANDAATTQQDTPVEIYVLSNDQDPDGDTLTVSGVGQPAHGTVSIVAQTRLRYTPSTGFAGQDSFSYTADDGRGGASTATVTVTVTAKPAPQATQVVLDDGDPGTTSSGTWVPSIYPGGYQGDSLANPGGADAWYRWTPNLTAGATYDVYLWWTAYYGRSTQVPVTVRHADGSTTSVVNQTTEGGKWNYMGTWRFAAGTSGWIEISGRAGQASADAARFTPKTDPAPPPEPLPVPNSSPIAVNDSATTVQGVPIDIDVLANDRDPDGDPLTVTGVTQPAHGSVAIVGGHGVTYSPAAGYTGPDSFGYQISDDKGLRASATVAVTVNAKPPIPPDPSPAEVVLDNGDPGTISSGSWYPSAIPGGYDGDSLVCMGRANEWYRWVPRIPTAGRYEVYMWWTSYLTRSRAVPVKVQNADGTAAFTVNQAENGGLWNRVGTWRFNAGESGFLEISGTDGQTSADAVRFVKVP